MPSRKTRFLVMDVDGTLTDGKIYVGQGGEAFKAFDVKDGLGIRQLLPPAGIAPVIITGRKSEILTMRCKELGIEEVYQGVAEKLKTLESILVHHDSSLEEVAYIGDDLNDLECMEAVRLAGGIVGCPSDAAKEVKSVANYVAEKPGGSGAVREVVDWLCGRS